MKVTKSTVHTLDTRSEIDNICIMFRQWKRYIRFLLSLALRVCQIEQLYSYLPNANTCDLTTLGWLLWAGYRGLATVCWLPWAGYRMQSPVGCLPCAGYRGLATVGWLPWAGYRGLATVGWLPWAGYRGLATVRCNAAGVGLLG